MHITLEILWSKGTQKLFGQVGGSSCKNPSHPQEFACSYTCELHQ